MTNHETTEIRIIGPHGVGKTTVIKALAVRMEKAGFSVFVFPEWSYLPAIPVGTLDFQLWYRKQMTIRKIAIDAIKASRIVDYILVDRDMIDVDIYSDHILGLPADIPKKYIYSVVHPENTIIFSLWLPPKDIEARLILRNAEEPWREAMGEEDYKYLVSICLRFTTLRKRYEWMRSIENVRIEDTIETMMRNIY